MLEKRQQPYRRHVTFRNADYLGIKGGHARCSARANAVSLPTRRPCGRNITNEQTSDLRQVERACNRAAKPGMQMRSPVSDLALPRYPSCFS